MVLLHILSTGFTLTCFFVGCRLPQVQYGSSLLPDLQGFALPLSHINSINEFATWWIIPPVVCYVIPEFFAAWWIIPPVTEQLVLQTLALVTLACFATRLFILNLPFNDRVVWLLLNHDNASTLSWIVLFLCVLCKTVKWTGLHFIPNEKVFF